MQRKMSKANFSLGALLCFIGLVAANTGGSQESGDSLPCFSDKGGPTSRFPVLPGGGWDNLRNRDMGPVADLSLRDCTLTVDGQYVIPNQVIVYPIKESRVSQMSYVVEHYSNYTSATSRSINVGGGGDFFDGLLGISGQYSQEFQEVKRTMLSSRTQVGRTQQRYNMYVARVMPEFRLSRPFKERLLDIGKALMGHQTTLARYLSDLLVHDFGTHVVTSLNAGALLEKVDYFQRDSLSSAVYTTNTLSQCMSAGFFDFFSIDASSGLTVSTAVLSGYRKTIQKTTVNTYGGPTMDSKVNLTKWASGLRQNLVAIDKFGDLLFTVITHRTLPELQAPYLKVVYDSVKAAVTRYYKMNEVKGCLDPDSPNFEPLANIEGSCGAPLTNFSFGGVFQTCEQTKAIGPSTGGVCGHMHSPMQVNYKTGSYSCPDGYEPTLLMSIIGDYRRWMADLFSRTYYEYETVLNTYWCAAKRGLKLPSQSGALYGGAYSPRVVNPATGARSCGAYYQPYTIGRDISLCISFDMTYAPRTRVPLGGFFSCVYGNPLAEPGRQVVASALHGVAASPEPKRCPDGFTQAALDVVDGCELMQCARLGATDLRRRGNARRPPYEEAPGEWATIGHARPVVSASGVQSLPTAPANATIAAIVLTCCLACIVAVVVVAIAVAYRRRRRRPCRESAQTGTDRQPLLGVASS